MKKKISKKISKNVSKKASKKVSKKVATKKKATSPKNTKKIASKHHANVVGKIQPLRKNIAKTASKNATHKIQPQKNPLNRQTVAKNLMNAIAKQFQIMLTPNEFIVRLTKNDFQQIEKLLSCNKSLIYCLLDTIRRRHPKYFDLLDPLAILPEISENSAANSTDNSSKTND